MGIDTMFTSLLSLPPCSTSVNLPASSLSLSLTPSPLSLRSSLQHRDNHHDMNVERAWEEGATGKGVVISILDDGIEHTHPDLKDNYVRLYITYTSLQ